MCIMLLCMGLSARPRFARHHMPQKPHLLQGCCCSSFKSHAAARKQQAEACGSTKQAGCQALMVARLSCRVLSCRPTAVHDSCVAAQAWPLQLLATSLRQKCRLLSQAHPASKQENMV